MSNYSILVEVYVDNNTAINKIASKKYTFNSIPVISISSQLTKILIYGLDTTTTLQTYFFFVDYAQATLQTITFPSETLIDPANYLAMVE